MRNTITAILLAIMLTSCGKSPSTTGITDTTPKNITTWVYDLNTLPDSVEVAIPTKNTIYLTYYPDMEKVEVYFNDEISTITESQPLLILQDVTVYYRFMYVGDYELNVSEVIKGGI
jgi:hypothetical protein